MARMLARKKMRVSRHSRKLASVMGGNLIVVSKQGDGSTFTARLPLRLPIADRNVRAATAQNASGPVVLAVDDNAVGLTVLRHALKRNGIQVECVSSGQEALDAASHRVYDLVLMDLQMPGMDGLTTAMEMRKVPGYAPVPIPRE